MSSSSLLLSSTRRTHNEWIKVCHSPTPPDEKVTDSLVYKKSHSVDTDGTLFIGFYNDNVCQIKMIIKDKMLGFCMEDDCKTEKLPINNSDTDEIPWSITEIEEVDERISILTNEPITFWKFFNIADKWAHFPPSIKSDITQLLSQKALNGTQKSIIEAFLQFPLGNIQDVLKEEPIKLIKAYEAILSQNLTLSEEKIHEEQNILDSIQEIRAIFSHPCPQNRRVGDPTAASGHDDGIISGEVYYWNNGFGSTCSHEPQGLLGLTAKNDFTAIHVTKEAVLRYISIIINERISLELNKLYTNNANILKKHSLTQYAFVNIVKKYPNFSSSFVNKLIKLKDTVDLNLVATAFSLLEDRTIDNAKTIFAILNNPERSNELARGFAGLCWANKELLTEKNIDSLIENKESSHLIGDACCELRRDALSTVTQENFEILIANKKNIKNVTSAIIIFTKSSIPLFFKNLIKKSHLFYEKPEHAQYFCQTVKILHEYNILSEKSLQLLLINIRYSVFILPILINLSSNNIVTNENFEKLMQYAQFSRKILLECMDKISQVKFDCMIEKIRIEMKVSFLMGTHARAGAASSMHPFFELEDKALSDKNVLNKVFSFI